MTMSTIAIDQNFRPTVLNHDESSRAIIVMSVPVDMKPCQAVDDEEIMVEYIAAVEEDVERFLKTQNHRISGIEEIIVDDTAAGLDYHVCAYLQQYPITIWPGRHNRSADDGRVFENMLKNHALSGSGPAILITVQPLKQAYIRPPPPHQVDIDFVGIQEGFQAHYATLVDTDVNKYLEFREESFSSFVTVNLHLRGVSIIKNTPLLVSPRGSRPKADPEPSRVYVHGAVAHCGVNASHKSIKHKTVGKTAHHLDNRISDFKGVQHIEKKFGKKPCHDHHQLGKCSRGWACQYLHDQIQFSPTASIQYRVYLGLFRHSTKNCGVR
ncbi:hypothetical protein HD553DRAFT_321419 [Filobasidium floriforme]|uniref:uncharacterized protein n=1 Tax=Filobasidium floriforme TaxID=5210 RepID=UPI001E8DF624|nr:uncharacterized protein HD553DRAFT_321419 [Filobasidium floriforme]KAH8090835.1 hypothetical protein HD553DRAFT_321419 [Filobasidium floriforme]